jgi:PAS domain S-box-containing protein
MPFTALPQESERLFRYLFEESSLGIAVENLEGRLLLANPALCSMLGYSSEELCNMNCCQFTDPEDASNDWALFQKLSAGLIERYSLEKRYVRKDGVRIWGRLNISVWKSSEGGDPLVFAFVEEVTDYKRAEEGLRESEERLRLAAEAGKMYAYQWDVATDIVERSPGHAGILGLTEPTNLTRQQLIERVHPEDRTRFIASVADLSPENPTTHITYRVVQPGGAVTWLEKTGRAYFDRQGRMLRMMGMVAEITSRKRAEEALSGVSRRLIEAQEKERARIARELHDDTNQRLGLLAIELQQLKHDHPGLTDDIAGRIDGLRKKTIDIAGDLEALAHELHSPKLEYLGIVAAMRSWCKEFGEQQRMEIDFKSHDLPNPLPSPEISLCLFRVLQEALHNAAKHSGVRHFEAELWGRSGAIHLAVRDLGKGFDSRATNHGRGLGLTSMRERLALVDGELSIESQPQHGTTVHACVALGTNADSAAATG